ncbi:MAG: O-acetylhomoserine aminocarboxypropyltransferase/cysteine synthase family protein [Schwartzia sp. (in: firmicutes)]
MKDETKCLHAGYSPKSGEPSVMPIVQSTTYRFDSTEHIAAVFDRPTEGIIYSRFANPTVDAVEKKIAELEGGVGAMCTTSGQAATLFAVLNLCRAGDSLISSSAVYGGTLNLFAVTLKRFGIECIFVAPDASEEELHRAFKPNTRLLFGETLANPSLVVCDIEKFARVAHAHHVPFLIDNTFATPILCKPFQFGADIVLHSTTKYMDGHALQGGGVIVDGGTFDWSNGNFPEFTTPDDSYHGIVYAKEFGNMAYIIKARMQLMRDIGAYPAAHSAFLLNLGLETLALRMPRYAQQGRRVAEYLLSAPQVESVSYPGLPNDPYHALAEKYLGGNASGVVTFILRGGRKAAMNFMDSLRLASNEVHVADIRTCVLHPASETHRQLSDEQLLAAGVHPGMIRLSVGLENIEDILADLAQAFAKLDTI